ncbi:MAG: GNAT family N-acetyltransferase [Proteobacteria bacterium]|nr:MAG: GNAT family N-acetyltransferase [Pseudomonadota bacterium]
MTQHSENDHHHLGIRHLTSSDYEDVKTIMDKVYTDIGGAWTQEEFLNMLSEFPEGQICIDDHGRVVAAAFTAIVDHKKFGRTHTYSEISGRAFMKNHDPEGDVLYGVDLFVDPDFRDLRLGRRLYDSRKDLCRKLNLRSILAGGRIPRYFEHSKELSPHEYIEKVSRREIHDPILSFQLANDFEVKRLLTAYLPEDLESGGYATLLEWNNIYYKDQDSTLFNHKKSIVRIGVVQWEMRELKSLEDLIQQVEYFVDALSYYKTDFTLLPEFFNAALLGLFEKDNEVQSIRSLAEFTPAIVEKLTHLSLSYNTNIIGGSMPVVENNKLYNVSYIFLRDGTIKTQYKIHITPGERRTWAMEGGDKLHVIDTDVGKIGVLICYDVEFPELARLQAEQGMKILFVPFWTDTKNGFLRVQRCAQARAIENECYVAISGSVGNLPNVENAEIQYAQSAVYSPSDFSFPHDAIMAETTPNTEMTLIVDVDMRRLDQFRKEGTVRNHLDRRHDLYKIVWNSDV